jgi:hydrogenase nickel incorporation protein HypB
MHKTTDLELNADIFGANRRLAGENHKLLCAHGIKSIDFLGSIGAGKTLIIERLVSILQTNGVRFGIIAGDVAGDEDYKRFKLYGKHVVNLNTGKECHLDAHLVAHALERFQLSDLDVILIENVGNLVCPVDFPLGTDKRVVIISVTEGEDKIRKHPVLFQQVDVIIINKIDLAEIMEVNLERIVKDARALNPHAPIILTDAKHKVGIDKLIAVLNLH